MQKRLLSGLLVGLWSATCLTVAEVDREWNHYGGSEKGQQYSPAKQINLQTVQNLEEAWRYRTGELGEGSRQGYSFQTNPILVNNTLYLSTGSGIIIAVDPIKGTEIWRYDPKLDRSKSTAETANRGVSSWIDASASKSQACAHRIYIGTLDARLIAVDGVDGGLCTDFGQQGVVDLSVGVNLTDRSAYEYSVTSPPVIVDGTLVVGSSIGDNRGVELERGIVRGFDARSGELKWSFDPIPRDESNPAFAGWVPEQARKSAAANAWAPLAADSELGIVYVPTGSVSPDFYGGERKGDNRYANSLVALQAATGTLVWHQQLIHHDVWDYDLPAQPTLVDLKHKGRLIPAVIQATKTGLLFTFDRRTGEPVFAIEERAVPQGGVLGEHLSKTQPFPVAPPPLLRHGRMTGDDAFGFALYDEWDCEDQFESLRSDGIFTPPSLRGTLQMPSYIGGINWGGVAFDETTQLAVARVSEVPTVVQLIKREGLQAAAKSGNYPDSQYARQTGTPYGMRRQLLMSPFGAPCSSPPWGKLVAVDMEKGEIQWQVPHGTIEDLVPAPIPNLELGVPGIGGPVITGGGLVFIAAAVDNYLRAYELSSGSEVWKARLPAGGQATPMTYVVQGRQYVVIAAGGHTGADTELGDYVLAFALPLQSPAQ